MLNEEDQLHRDYLQKQIEINNLIDKIPSLEEEINDLKMKYKELLEIIK